jgi:hypothetical protein
MVKSKVKATKKPSEAQVQKPNQEKRKERNKTESHAPEKNESEHVTPLLWLGLPLLAVMLCVVAYMNALEGEFCFDDVSTKMSLLLS